MSAGRLVRGDNYRKSFQESGNTQDSVWSCGQSIGLIDEASAAPAATSCHLLPSLPAPAPSAQVLPCAAIVQGVVDEAATIIRSRLLSKL